MAEGIETEAQETILRELGCRRGQGYVVPRAVTRDEFAAMLGV